MGCGVRGAGSAAPVRSPPRTFRSARGNLGLSPASQPLSRCCARRNSVTTAAGKRCKYATCTLNTSRRTGSLVAAARAVYSAASARHSSMTRRLTARTSCQPSTSVCILPQGAVEAAAEVAAAAAGPDPASCASGELPAGAAASPAAPRASPAANSVAGAFGATPPPAGPGKTTLTAPPASWAATPGLRTCNFSIARERVRADPPCISRHSVTRGTSRRSPRCEPPGPCIRRSPPRGLGRTPRHATFPPSCAQTRDADTPRAARHVHPRSARRNGRNRRDATPHDLKRAQRSLWLRTPTRDAPSQRCACRPRRMCSYRRVCTQPSVVSADMRTAVRDTCASRPLRAGEQPEAGDQTAFVLPSAPAHPRGHGRRVRPLLWRRRRVARA